VTPGTRAFLGRITATGAPVATVLIRLAVGGIFLSEGIQKFLFPNELGVGRFTRIGIPVPALMAPFVGLVEIGCGLLILLGLATRVAAVPLIVVMIVAIASTKLPILLGRGYFLFANPSVSKHGLLSMLHEARTDLSLVFGSIFLLRVGAGGRSLDALVHRRLERTKADGQ
jgi:putative oxidoreductase